ncbi:MAG: DUF1365 domain-containing protein [Rubrivivax sp.]|nr:DUF1365 domain-containing protein [Rubrivivax sp.]
MTGAALVIGQVRHERLRPKVHAFEYPTMCVLLPMRRWARDAAAAPLPRNRRTWMSFHDQDHGDGGADALAWIERLLAAHGVHDADGEIWLQTYPRVLGFVFKPVSFWYCHRTDGRLRAVVAEVNNTFGERHCYLLGGPDVAWGRTLVASKSFHVSPFLGVGGDYRFRFLRTAGRIVARVDHHDGAGLLLTTSISGRLTPLTGAAARAALLRMPLLTLGVVARIHWQALRLWLGRVPFHRKPAPPAHTVTRQADRRSLPAAASSTTPSLAATPSPQEHPA